jgi:hypothetical protein
LYTHVTSEGYDKDVNQRGDGLSSRY